MLQPLGSRDDQPDFRAAGDQNELRFAVRGVAQHIAAAAQPIGRGVAVAVEGRQVLPAQCQYHRPVSDLQRDAPGHGGFVGIRGAYHDQIGNRAQVCQLLDRLMRRSVLAERKTVVSEYMDDVQAHQRSKPDGRAHVVGKDQERRAVGNEPTVRREAVDDGTHRVFAHAEV